jgi:hypothetical protein
MSTSRKMRMKVRTEFNNINVEHVPKCIYLENKNKKSEGNTDGEINRRK